MNYIGFSELNRFASSPENQKDTVDYLAENMSLFLRPHENALICFPCEEPDSIGYLLKQAVILAEGIPVVWEPDQRWKTLLRLAFTSRASAILAPPMVALGLTKLAKHTGTPLSIRSVMTAGYPCFDWMIDGIRRGLDCDSWGCFGPGSGSVVSGFSCGKSRGVHIRDDMFVLDIEDQSGNRLEEGNIGNIVLSVKKHPQMRFRAPEYGRLDTSACPCGCSSPRLMDIGPGQEVDKSMEELGQRLMYWSSVLDCSLKQGEYGLEMELVVFPGQQLPKLPSCARRIIRQWEPDRDCPM